MDKKCLKDGFPTQQEWLADMRADEKVAFIMGGLCYDAETEEGKKVFTLRAAWKYSYIGLKAIVDYMIVADRIDMLEKEKDIQSFRNVMRAMMEKAPSPLKGAVKTAAQSLEDFKMKHPEYFETCEEENTEC